MGLCQVKVDEMTPCKNKCVNTGIVVYDYDDGKILVEFSGNMVYECHKEEWLRC